MTEDLWPGRAAEARRLGIDPDDDMRDGILFRFWIRMAETKPGRTATVLYNCHTIEDYRVALTLYAKDEGVNLP